MLCIIAGHFGKTSITRFVFTFHVPVFLILSGLFYSNDFSRLKRTVFKLIKPYMFTVLCIALLDAMKAGAVEYAQIRSITVADCLAVFWKNLLAGIYGSGSRNDFLKWTIPAIGAIWFYLALMWTQIIVNVTNIFIKIKNASGYIRFFAAAVAFWLIGYFSAKVTWLPLSVQAGFCGVVFFVCGMCVHAFNTQINEAIKKRSYKYAFLLLMIVIWTIAIIKSYTNDYMSLVRCAFPDPVVNILGALAAVWVLIMAARRIEFSRLGQFFQYIGKNSMVFLSLHLMELNIVPWGKIVLRGISGDARKDLLIFFLKVGWCFAGLWVIKKMRFTRWIYSLPQN